MNKLEKEFREKFCFEEEGTGNYYVYSNSKRKEVKEITDWIKEQIEKQITIYSGRLVRNVSTDEYLGRKAKDRFMKMHKDEQDKLLKELDDG